LILIIKIMKFLDLSLLVSVEFAWANKHFLEDAPACRRVSNAPQPGFIRQPLTPVENLPEQHLWNNVDGVNYLTNIRN
jgi:hypothetical protein